LPEIEALQSLVKNYLHQRDDLLDEVTGDSKPGLSYDRKAPCAGNRHTGLFIKLR